MSRYKELHVCAPYAHAVSSSQPELFHNSISTEAIAGLSMSLQHNSSHYLQGMFLLYSMIYSVLLTKCNNDVVISISFIQYFSFQSEAPGSSTNALVSSSVTFDQKSNRVRSLPVFYRDSENDLRSSYQKLESRRQTRVNRRKPWAEVSHTGSTMKDTESGKTQVFFQLNVSPAKIKLPYLPNQFHKNGGFLFLPFIHIFNILTFQIHLLNCH